MKRWILGLILVGSIGAFGYFAGRARAAGIPQTGTLNYTGTLLAYGQPDNSMHNITINLWANGSVACSTSAPSTQLSNGRFTVPLSSDCVAVVHANPNVTTEVVIDGTSLGQTSVGAVPYAVEADTASNVAPGSSLAQQVVPSGTVIAYAGPVTSPPAGWLFCNGQAVSRTEYANLFAIIGTAHGSGDGATTFNLPDYRGYFLRGVDDGANRDPNKSTRTAMASGGNTGDEVGSVEAGEFASHNHAVTDPGHSHGVNDPGHNHGGSTGGVDNQAGATNFWRDYNTLANNPDQKGFEYVEQPNYANDFDGHTHSIPVGYTGISIQGATTGISIQNNGGAETRPLNAFVNYLIKY